MQSEEYPQGSPSQPPLVVPDDPCPNGYLENHWKEDLARGWRKYEGLMGAPLEHWQELGERAGVRRSVFNDGQPLPAEELETSRGISFFEGVQALDVFSCIYNPGFRLIWDHRIKESSILQRFSQAEFLFYLVLRGIGPIYWPRDYIGVEGVRFYKSNGEVVTTGIPSECSCIDVIWTSVNNPPHGPQEGKVRAKMNLVAYRIQNRGNGCEVTFMISICMSGPIPGYIRRMLVAECPLSLARLRDAIPTFGVCPYLIDEQSCLVIQRHFWDAESRKSHMRAFSTKAGTVVIVLDTKRMYPSGIMMPTIEGPGATSVSVQEAITGDRLFVHVDGTALGKMWTLVSVGVGMRSQSSAADSSSFRQQSFEPRDKDPEPDASGDWW